MVFSYLQQLNITVFAESTRIIAGPQVLQRTWRSDCYSETNMLQQLYGGFQVWPIDKTSSWLAKMPGTLEEQRSKANRLVAQNCWAMMQCHAQRQKRII